MKIYIYIVLFIIPTAVFAQVPGYQGKRLSVEGDFFFMSALLNPNQNGRSVECTTNNINNNGSYNSGYNNNNEPSFDHASVKRFNSRYNVNFSYVLSKEISLELTGGLFNTGWNRKFTEIINTVDPNYGSVTTDRYKFSDLYRVHGKMVGMNFKFFRKNKGAIAPNGSYFKIGGSYIMNTPTYVGAYENTGYGISNGRAGSTNMVLFTCGLGKQTIFYDRLIFRYGIEFGMSPTVLKRIKNDLLFPTNNYYNGGDTGYTLNERVLLQNLVNLNLGLGIILF